MSASCLGIAGGEQNVTDTIKDTRIGFFCKTENDRITVNNGVTAIEVIVGHRNIACKHRLPCENRCFFAVALSPEDYYTYKKGRVLQG